MKCGECGDWQATRYGLDGNVIRLWCICCRQGGKPLRPIWLRPFTVVWHHWMKLRGGETARKRRVLQAARNYDARLESPRDPA